MDFLISEERRILTDTIDKFFSNNYSIKKRLTAVKSDVGYDLSIWKDSCDLGIISSLIPSEFGGFGGSGEDITTVFEILGRHLVVEPFLSTGILGSVPLWKINNNNCKKILSDILVGNVHVTLAFTEHLSRYSLSYVETKANFKNNKFYITGHKSIVMNAKMSDFIIVSARIDGKVESEEGLGLFIVEKESKGLKKRSYGTIDSGHACDLWFDEVEAKLLNDNAYLLLELSCAYGILALSAEAIGIMDKIKDTTLEYLKTRKQFGKPLSSFQVLQHRMVELVTEIEQARSSVMLASSYLEENRTEREKHISAVKNLIGRVGKLVAEETIQMHGGIAMCWEYDIAHYAKRLVMIDHILGDVDHHAERFSLFSSQN